MFTIQCTDCHVLNCTLCWRNTYIHPSMAGNNNWMPTTTSTAVIIIRLRHLLTLCWAVGNGLRVSVVWAGLNTNKSLQYYVSHTTAWVPGVFAKTLSLSVLHSAHCLSPRTGIVYKHHYQAPSPTISGGEWLYWTYLRKINACADGFFRKNPRHPCTLGKRTSAQ